MPVRLFYKILYHNGTKGDCKGDFAISFFFSYRYRYDTMDKVKYYNYTNLKE